MSARSRRHDPFTRVMVLLPERDLTESILDFAAPLTERLGVSPHADDLRRAIGLAVDLWNAHVTASPRWEVPRPRALADLRKAMRGRKAPSGFADAFEVLSARWQKDFGLEPRLVKAWSLEVEESGGHRLMCEMALPVGVEALMPPPIEKRIAIGGKFLDEVQIRLDTNSLLSFPVQHHSGLVGSDGIATVRSMMPTVVQLFAEGRLPSVGGASVDVMVGGKCLGPMLLVAVRCAGGSLHRDVAELEFRPASECAA